MKRNLLYIVTKLELGGAQKHVLELIRRTDQGLYNVHLFSSREGVLWPEARAIPGLRVCASAFLERGIHPVKDLLALAQIAGYIRKHKIDLVHTHSSKAGILGRWAARLAGVKTIIHTVHGWSFHGHQAAVATRLFQRLERFTAPITDKIIVVSVSDEQKGLRCRIGVQDQYVRIPCGIDVETFDGAGRADDSLRRELGLKSSDLLVGSIACLKRQKAPEDFIRLAHMVKPLVPNAKFLLAGDGTLRGDVAALAKKLNVARDVFLLGWRRDIPRFLRAIDVFVLTSLWEGLPVSVLEAMAASRPVLVTDTGGVADVVVEGETGFLVSPGDVRALTHKLVGLLADADLRRRIGTAARQSLPDAFRTETMARRVFVLYDSFRGRESSYAG